MITCSDLDILVQENLIEGYLLTKKEDYELIISFKDYSEIIIKPYSVDVYGSGSQVNSGHLLQFAYKFLEIYNGKAIFCFEMLFPNGRALKFLPKPYLRDDGSPFIETYKNA